MSRSCQHPDGGRVADEPGPVPGPPRHQGVARALGAVDPGGSPSWRPPSALLWNHCGVPQPRLQLGLPTRQAKPNFGAIPVPGGMQKSQRSPFIPPPGPAWERVALPRGNKEKEKTWQPEEEVWQTLQQSQAPEELVCMVLGCVCMCARLWLRRSE